VLHTHQASCETNEGTGTVRRAALRGVDGSGRDVATESAAAPEALWPVDDVERGSAPGAVRLFCESTEGERAADADSNERDARDACRID